MLKDSSRNNFKSGQIVCLESDSSYLYGEVIQVIVQRQICWVRPITIAILTDDYDVSYNIAYREIIDLPIYELFIREQKQAFLALEEMQTKLAEKEQSSDLEKVSFHLNSFVKEVWINNQEIFTSSDKNKSKAK